MVVDNPQPPGAPLPRWLNSNPDFIASTPPAIAPMDTLLNAADSALRTLFAKPHACRTCPTVAGQGTTLSAADKALAGALMRVNHVGEVCAQALYASQALSTRNPVLREQFLAASKEEGDRLDAGAAGRAGRTALAAKLTQGQLPIRRNGERRSRSR